MTLLRLIAGGVLSLGIACLYFGAWIVAGLLKLARPVRSNAGADIRLMITGRVNSNNWSRSHLLPLAQAANVSEVLAAMDGPLIQHPKMRPCLPGRLTQKLLPRALARSVALFAAAFRERPDVVMGYSLFPGAVFSLLAARLVGAKAIYQNTGGVFEIESGCVAKEHKGATVPEWGTRLLRALAFRLCGSFDGIVVRGDKTKEYLLRNSDARAIQVIAGSVDPERFAGGPQQRDYDVVFLGRMVAVKQPDHLLEALARVAKNRMDLRAVIAGGGPLFEATREKARKMGIEKNVTFLGHVENVAEMLLRTKVFILTSKSEGLSIALAEAMMAGAVPVVADVGDLSELVHSGETGHLIPPGDFDAYAARICEILDRPALWQSYSTKAREIAIDNNSLPSVTARWEKCFRAVTAPDAAAEFVIPGVAKIEK